MPADFEIVKNTKVVSSRGKDFVLRAGLLFDGKGKTAAKDRDILVRGGRIEAVGAVNEFKALGLSLLDHSDKFVMPGLIEAHLHLSGMHTQEKYSRYFENKDVRLIRALNHAEELLAHGFTTVRELGAKGRGIGIREGIAKGLCHGPRILTSIEFLSPTGGHGDWPIFPYDFVKDTSMRSVLVDGVDECVKAVRLLLREGADFVKIVTATGGFGQVYEEMKFRPCFNMQEILAMSNEAHEQGKKIASHVVGYQGAMNAINGGIDTLEHCFFNFEKHPEVLDAIVKKGLTVVPTMSIIKWFGEYEEQTGRPDAAARFYRNVEKHGRFVKAAWEAGVPIACGTDENGMHGTGRCPEEYVSLVQAGLPEYAVLQGATSVAAATLGLENETGTIESGKIADILVLNKNPLDDISVLRFKESVDCVIQG